MPEDKQALLQHYRQMRESLLSAIDGLSNELMSEPSLDGWSVKDHLAHLAFWDELRAAEIGRISAGHRSLWRLSDPQVDTANELVHHLRKDVSPEQARWEVEHIYDLLLGEIENATGRGLDGSLYGEAALKTTHDAEHTEWIQRWRSEKGV